MGYRYGTIGFLSDYGLADIFVGVCHGVLRRLAPEATVVDVTHAVPAHDVAAGARRLAHAVAYFSPAVHLAVVDPGVGTGRRGVALETGDGSCLVGPDNGLLLPAARALGGIGAAVALTNPELQLAHPSTTFHGRDIFAPAAGHLARGVPAVDFGDPVASANLVDLRLPEAVVREGGISGEVVEVDHFGNLATNISAANLAQAGLRPGDLVSLEVGGHCLQAPYRTAFAEVAPGAVTILVDSFGAVAVCLNQASAAHELQAGRGTAVSLGPA